MAFKNTQINKNNTVYCLYRGKSKGLTTGIYTIIWQENRWYTKMWVRN